MATSPAGPEALRLHHMIGFGGTVVGGLKWHPDGVHVIFPLGSTLIVRNTADNSQAFLYGHTDKITAVALSKCGRYIATGQQTDGSAKVPIIVWDFEASLSASSPADSSRIIIHSLVLHKGSVQSLDFSHDSVHLASVGGPDDNTLCVWEVTTGRAICGTPAGSHAALSVTWFRGRSDKLLTCGQYHVRCWDLNPERRRLVPDDWKTGSIKRVFTCAVLDDADARAFLGTSSGDILEFNAVNGNFLQASKVRFSLGVLSMTFAGAGMMAASATYSATAALAAGGSGAAAGATGRAGAPAASRAGAATSGAAGGASSRSMGGVGASGATARAGGGSGAAATGGMSRAAAAATAAAAAAASEDTLLVGTGDGAFVRMAAGDLSVRKVAECMGGVTSIALSADGTGALAGTEAGNLYLVPPATCEAVLLSTAHAAPIADVVFPAGTSDLFLTASGGDIRIWNTRKCSELLRIQVPNLKVTSIAINAAGTSIVSGWDDGKVRAFLPESGKLQYAIPEAHADAVTAVAFTPDGSRVVSGGRDGRVRVWNVSGRAQTMEFSFKEHKREVTSIAIGASGEEALTASADGSCCIWNIRKGSRLNALFASTVFRAAVYHPDESQLLTAGSDRRLTYWDAVDCSAIRIMDGSTEEITSVDIDASGTVFASAGLDRQVKLWRYDEGDCLRVGRGHSGAVNKVKISPDGRLIISGGAEGAILIWAMPGEEETVDIHPAPPAAAAAAAPAAKVTVAASATSAVGARRIPAPLASTASAAPRAPGSATGGAGTAAARGGGRW